MALYKSFVAAVIAVKSGLINCSDAQRGYLRGGKAFEAIKLAKTLMIKHNAVCPIKLVGCKDVGARIFFNVVANHPI